MIAVNEYFSGQVKSLSFENSQGKVTSGVMDIGEFTFSTSAHELMKVISGELLVKLPGETSHKTYSSGTEFEVAANTEFDVIVKEQTAYLCFYS
ncbi:MAG: pyrimidine/purine nucleoside phosphorylase [Oceanospirillaceae bacterium]|nr:pyrimidine/purine nucleoside phosphorylase [Oceanospirillaceae bacterium]